MCTKIGFAILSHSEPNQLRSLTATLNAMFDRPAIVCHHDFSKCPLDESKFEGNVRFVHPHFVTGWGNINVPLAALKAFKELWERDRPDWFVLLSGSDYPVKPAEEIIAELSGGKYDVYLDHREISYRAIPPEQTAKYAFGSPGWISLAYNRYLGIPLFWWPRPSKARLFSGRFPFVKRYVFLRNPRILDWLNAKRPSRVYGGDFWFEANAKAIGRLLDDPTLPQLIDYFSGRPNVDEALFHTVLCGHADLRMCKDHKRYEDWSADGKHPKWLEISDVTKIAASGAHFARKFKPEGVVQDFIDSNLLGIKPKARAASAFSS